MKISLKYSDYHWVEHQELLSSYNQYFELIPISSLSQVIAYLTTRIKQSVLQSETHIYELPTEAISILDEFLFKEFRQQKLIKPSEDKERTKPMSYVLKRVTNRLFKEDGSNVSDPFIYSALEAWVYNRLGKSVGVDPELQDYEIWVKIKYLTEICYDFYFSWKDSIPVENIKNQIFKITHLPSKREIFEDSRMLRESNYELYEEHLLDLKSKPSWIIATTITRSSDYLSLSLKMSLNFDLIKRLSSKELIDWIETIEITLIQDTILFRIREPEDLLSLIKQFLKDATEATSKDKVLFSLLINNFFKSLKGISQRLDVYTEEHLARDLYINERQKVVYHRGIEEKVKWFEHELPRLVEKLFEEIFHNNANILNNKYFNDINGLIGLQVEKDLSTNRSQGHYNITIKHLTGEFSKHLLNVKISDYLESINLSNISWGQLAQISQLVRMNRMAVEKDDLAKILSSYKIFIASSEFYLPQEISEATIQKCRDYAEILSLLSNPLDEFQKNYGEYINYQEGWRTTNNDHKNVYKEFFILCTGCLMIEAISHRKFTDSYEPWYILISQQLFEKHRFSHNENIYYLTLILLGSAIEVCYPKHLKTYLADVVQNLDEVDKIIGVFANLRVKIDKSRLTQLQKLVNDEYPIMQKILLSKGLIPNVKKLEEQLKKLSITY